MKKILSNIKIIFLKLDRGKKIKTFEKEYPNVLSIPDTINIIFKEKKSISRFGDGEFTLLRGKNIKFQKSTVEIRKKLQEILQNNQNEEIIIAIPPFTPRKEYCMFWEKYWFFNFNKLKKFWNNKKVYGNANITRIDYFDYFGNNTSEITKIWENKSVVFIYGENGRFNINSPLFENITSKKTILTKSENAFDDYNTILNSCLLYSKETLFLVACGPTATILTYELSQLGYQAIDIGHIPNSYDQYLGKIINPEILPISKK